MINLFKRRIALMLCISLILCDTLVHISYANENEDAIESTIENTIVESTTYHEEYQEITKVTEPEEVHDIISSGSEIDDSDIFIEEENDDEEENENEIITYEEEPEEDEVIIEDEEPQISENSDDDIELDEVEEENVATSSDIIEDEMNEEQEEEVVEEEIEEEVEEEATVSDAEEIISIVNDVDENIDIATISEIDDDIEIATTSEIDENIDIATTSEIDDDIEIATTSEIDENIDIATVSEIDKIIDIATVSEIDKIIDIATASDINDIEILDNSLKKEIYGLSNNKSGLLLLGSSTPDYYIFHNTWFDETEIPKRQVSEIVFKKGGEEPSGEPEICEIDGTNGLLLYIYENGQNSANEDLYKVIIYAENDYDIKLTNKYGSAHSLFDGLINLERIVGLENLDISEANNISGMFNFCYKLKEANFKSLNTKNIVNMSMMFNDCLNLMFDEGTDTITSFDTSKVTNMSNMFSNCHSATEIYINTFNTENVVNMKEMFSMKSDTNKLTYICAGPGFTTINVKESENMFFQCKKLKAIDSIGEYEPIKQIVDKTYAVITGRKYNGFLTLLSIETDNNYLFRSDLIALFKDIDDNRHLDALGIDLGDTLNIVTSVPEYKEHYLYTTITRYNILHNRYTDAFTFLIVKNNLNHIESYLVVSEKTKILDGISFFAYFDDSGKFREFKCSKSLKNIVGLEHLDFSNCTSFDDMFNLGKELNYVGGLETIDTHMATSMKSMFEETALREIDISHFDVRNCINFEKMFANCISLGKIKLCNFNTYEHANYKFMFEKCEGITYPDCGLDLVRFGERENLIMPYFISWEWGIRSLYLEYEASIEHSNHIINKHTFDYLPIPKSDVKKITIDISDKVPSGGKMFPIYQKHGAMAGYVYDNNEVVLYGRNYPTQIAWEDPLPMEEEYFPGINPPVYIEDEEGIKKLHPDWYPSEFFCHFDEDASSTFEGFTNLEEIINLDQVFIDNIKNASRMFYGCKKLKNVSFSEREYRYGLNNNIIPAQNFKKCEDFSEAFYGCENLKTIEKIEIQSLVNATSMFENCNSLRYVNIKSNSSSINQCGKMFYNCSMLEKIVVSKENPFNLTSCNTSNDVFTGCEKLEGDHGTTYSSSNTGNSYGRLDAGNTSPGYFSGGTDKYFLPEDWYIDLYELVDTEYNKMYHTEYSIEHGMTIIPVIDTIKIEKSSRTTSRKKIIHNSYGLEVYIDSYNDKDGSIIVPPYITIGIPDTNIPIYTYDSCVKMFAGFVGVKAIEGLDNIHFDNAEDMTLMFAENDMLEYLIFGSNFRTPNLKDTSSMFKNDKNLKSIMFPYEYNFDMSNVDLSHSRDMFFNCENLLGYRETRYDKNETNGKYARFDEGKFGPGYFSRAKYKFIHKTKYDSKRYIWSFVHLGESIKKMVFQYGDIPIDKYEKFEIRDGCFIFNQYFDEANKTLYFHSPFEKEKIVATIFGKYSENSYKSTVTENIENVPNIVCVNNDYSNLFSGFYGLQYIDCLEWGLDKVNITNAENMFANLGLYTITIDNFDKIDFSNVENTKNIFSKCGINKLSMKNMDLSKFTNTNMIFPECGGLAEVDITNTILPEDTSGLFANLKNLQKVIGVASVSNVKYASDVFFNCEKLTEIDMTGIDLSNCVTTRRMFENCRNLKKIKGLGSINFNKCRDMSGMFCNCALEKIDLSSTIRTEKASDNNDITYCIDHLCSTCVNLRYVNLGTFNDANVSAKSLFYNCKKLEFAYLHDAHIKHGDGMFFGCKSLRRIGVLNDNSIDARECKGIFADCNSLLDPAGSHYSYRSNCDDCARVPVYIYRGTIPYQCGYFSYIYSIDKNWVNNLPISKESVTKIIFTNESKIPIGTKFIVNDNRYWNNKNLYGYVDGTTVKIHIPNITEILVADTDLSELFSGLTNLQEINGIELLETYQTFDMSDMFSDCKKLGEINLKSISTSNLENTKNMFKGDIALGTIYASSSFKLDHISESENMFYGCEAIVGGNLTYYDENKVDSTYARLDIPDTPGYFSDTKAFNSLILKNQGVITPKIKLYPETNPGVNINKAFKKQNVIVDCTELSYLLDDIVVHLYWESDKYEEEKATYKSENKYVFTMKDCDVIISITAKLNDNHARYYFTGDINNKTMHFTKTFYDRLDNYYSFGETFNEATVSEVKKIVWDTIFKPDTIENLFSGFKKLTNIDFAEINFANVTSMKNACHGCESLTKISMPMDEITKVTDISHLFEGCTNLTDVDFNSFYGNLITDMSGLFRNCTSFTAIDLSTLDTTSLTNATDMFSGCTNLKNIYSNSFNATNLPETQIMFDGCVNLEGDLGTKYSVENDKTARYAYLDTVEKKGYFSIPFEKVYYYVDTKNYILYLNAKEVNSKWAEYNGSTYLKWAPNIKKVIIETRIHPDKCNNFFRDLKNLREIENIENLSTHGVKNFSNMFGGITGNQINKLILDLSKFDFSAATDMSLMFNRSSAISCIYANLSVKIPANCNTNNMFTGCTNLMGSKGTRYNASFTNRTYARIDGGSARPGYFSEKVPMKGLVYWALSTDKTSLHLAGYKIGPYNWHNDNYTYESLTGDQKIKIQKVIIDNEILPTSCYRYFDGMNILTNIENIHYINTESVTNMQGMFSGDKNLTYLDLARFNTNNVTDMSEMFYHCDSLSYLYIDNFNTKNVINMSNMFYYCDALENLNTIRLNTENVTNMSGMFSYSGIRDDINLTNFNTSKVTDMHNMFAYMKNAKSIDVSNFNTENVTNMSGMFGGSANLEEIIGISSLNTLKVENMSKMFSNLPKIERLELYEYDTKNVIDMSEMFASSENLKRIYVSNKFVLDKVKSSSNMFAGCNAIVGGSGTTYDSTNIDNTYARYDKGTSEPGYFSGITPIEGVVYWYLDGTVLNLTTVCPDDVDYTTDKWNYNMDSLTPSEKSSVTKVYVFNDFGNIMPTNMKGWFKDFTTLTNFEEFNKIYTEKVTDMSYLFDNCTNLSNINIDYLNTKNVTTMSYMFNNCTSMTDIKVSRFNTNKVTDMSYMLSNLNVSDIDISKLDTTNVTNFEGIFSGLLNIEKIHLETLDTRNATNMKNMFANATSLYRIYVSKKFVTTNVIVSDGMFSGCTSLYGSAGTKCDTVFDASYAKMDGGTLDPGYFMSDEIKKGVIYWKLTDSDTVLHLFGICPDDIDYTTGVWNYNENNNSLSSFAIEEVKRKNIEKVVIDVENGEKLIPTKMDSWFRDFEKLTKINDITKIDMTNVTTLECLFKGCKKLSFVFLENLDTSNVTNMNYMFQGIDARGIGLGVINTAKATSMKGMFADCANLKNIDFTSNNISSVSDASYMFSNCTSLSNVTFANSGTSIKNAESMFEGCTNLERIYADVDFTGLTSSNNMFNNCTNIKAGNSTIYDVTHIDGSYAKVDNLLQKGYFTTLGYHEVSVDDRSVDKIKVYIDGVYDHEAFSAFENQKIIVKVVNVGTWQKVSKDDIKLSVSTGTIPIVSEVMGVTNTFSFMMPASDTKVSFNVSIKDNTAFYHKSTDSTTLYITKDTAYASNVYEFGNTFDASVKSGVKIVVIEYPTDDKKYKTNTLKNMFNGFTDLIRVFGLNNIDGESVTDISYMFNGCTDLLDVDFRDVDLNNVTDFTNTFNNCTNIEKINVNDDFVLKSGATCTDMFNNCTKIIGGNNTLFDASHIESDYARIDKVSQPGYFTDSKSHNIIINDSLICTYSIIRSTDNLSNIKKAVSGQEIKIDLTPYIWQENIKLDIKVISDGSKVLYTEISPNIYIFNMPDSDIEFVDCKSDIKEDYCFYYSTPSETNPTKDILYLTTDFAYHEKYYHFGEVFDSAVSTNVEKVIVINTIKPTTLKNLFNGFIALTDFDINKISTMNVTSLSSMFEGCSSLLSIKDELDTLITDNVTDYSSMFKGCTSLTDLNLISFNTASGTNFDNMFYGDTTLHTIFTSNNFTVNAMAIGIDMFENCTSIVGKIKISDTEYDPTNKTPYNPSYVDKTYARVRTTTDDGYFTYNGELELCRIYWKVDNNILYLSSYKKDGWNDDYVNQKSTIADKSNIATVSFVDTVITNNLDSWFEDFTGLCTFENFDNLNTTRVTSMKKTFKNCKSLQYLDLNSFDTSLVIDMSELFSGCNNLSDVNLSTFDTANVTNMSRMFKDIISTESITFDLRSFNTINVTNMSEMFSGDKNIKSIYVSDNFLVTGVINSNNMFYNCINIVGSNGTKYNNLHTDKTYAIIDKVSQAGYLDNGLSNNIMCSCPSGVTYKIYRENDNVEVYNAVENQSLIFEILGVNEWQTILSVSISDRNHALSYVKLSDTKYKFTMSNTDVTIGNIEYITDEDYAFYYFSDNGKTLHLTRDESRSAYKFGNKFAATISEVTEQVIFDSMFDASTYKNLFNDFTALTNVKNFYRLRFNKATDISYMFNNCEGLINLDLSSANISSASNTSYMFNDCTNLETIRVADNFAFKNVTESTDMFKNCEKLVGGNGTVYDSTKVDATYAKIDKIASVSTISGEDDQIGYLTDAHSYNLTVKNDVDMLNVYRGESAYKSAKFEEEQLVHIKISSSYYQIDSINIKVADSNQNVDPVIELVDGREYLFFMPDGNVNVDFTYSVAPNCFFYTINDNVLTLVNDDMSTDSSYKYYHFGDKFEDIGSNPISNVNTIIFDCDVETDTLAHLFDGFTNLTTVEGFDRISGDIEDTSFMFNGCKKLQDIDFLNIDTSNIINMNCMFSNTAFKTLNLTNFDTSNVVYFTDMFKDSNDLERIFVSDKFVVGSAVLDEIMFTGCTKLIGGNNTRYDSTKTKALYAVIDDLPHEGYLTGSNSHNVSIDQEYKYKDKLKVFKQGQENQDIPRAVDGQELYIDVSNLETWQRINNVIVSLDGGSKIYATKVSGYDTRYVFTMPTSDVTISADIIIDNEYAFYYKTGTTLHLTTDETYKSNVYKFGNAFSTFVSLNVTNVIVDNYFSPSTIKNLFSGFKKLETYDISKINLSGITDISYMFKNCESLTSVNINQLFMPNITNFEGVFDGGKGLTFIDLNDVNLSSASNVKYLFRNCTNLSTILKNIDFTYRSDIVSDGMFEGATKLIGGNNTKYDSTKVDISYANPDIAGRKGYYTNDKVFVINKSPRIEDMIDIYMTGENDKITRAVASQSITFKISDAYPDSIVRDVKITKASDPTIVLSHTEVVLNKEYKFEMPDFDVSIDMTIFNVDDYSYYYVDTSDNSIHYTGTTLATASVIIKGTYIFGENIDYTNKSNLIIAYIECDMKPQTFANMFNGFTSLASVSSISRINTSKCVSMENMFADCSSLPDIDLTNFATSNVTNMSKMFYNCQSLTSLDLNSFDTDNVYRFESTFESCTNLEIIEASDKFKVDYAGYSANMFNGCTSIVGNGRTTYDSTHIDKEYARVDTLDNPGYFSHGDLSVSFNTNGGSYVANVTVSYGNKISSPTTSRNNYTFVGWYEDSTYTKTFDFNSAVTHDMTLYANWRREGNGRGGGGGGGGGGSVHIGGRIASDSIFIRLDPIKENAILAYEKSKSTYIYDNNFVKWIYNPIENTWGLDVIINGFQVSSKNMYVIINNSTYYFDESDKMITGWVKDTNGHYYVFEWEKTINEGMMITGWRLINNKWYYFMPTGELLINAITPDGYIVDNEGEWHPKN